jgi:uncharacterized membrane protein
LNITKLLISFLLTIPIFVILDLLWLGVIAKSFYQNQLGHLLSHNVNWPAAIIFYFVYITGIFIFCVYPAISKGDFLTAIIFGVIFGIIAYGTYDLTNLATLNNWPVKLTVIDLAWGGVLTGIVASWGFLVSKWLNL